MTSQPHRDPHAILAPSPWILRHAHLVPQGARVLDLACGYGRRAVLRWKGMRVVAADRDASALSTLQGVAGNRDARCGPRDGPLAIAGEGFDAIVVANYLYRPALGHIVAAIEVEGTLLFETFARGNRSVWPALQP
jgi:SAM-dependent methyltransferase